MNTNKIIDKKKRTSVFSYKSILTVLLFLVLSCNFFQRCFCQQVLKEGTRILKSTFCGLNFLSRINLFEIKINLLMNLGIHYWNTGDISKSLDTFKKSYEQSASEDLIKENLISEMSIKIINLYLKGKQLRNENDLSGSCERFQHAVNLARLYNIPEFEEKCLRQLGVSYWEKGDYQNFYKMNKSALEIARSLNNKREESRCLNNIGLYKWRSSYYTEALDHYHEALNIITELDNKPDESDCLNNIGIIYKEIGNYQKSLDYLNEALEIDKSLQNDLNIAIDLNNLGTACIRKGDKYSDYNEYHAALNYFEEGILYAKKLDRDDIFLKIANNVGLVYMKMGEYQLALKYFQDAYETSKSLGILDSKYTILNNLGMIHLKLGEIDRAEHFFNQVIHSSLKNINDEVLIESYYGLGLLANKRKQYLKALGFYKRSINAIEKIKRFIFLDEYKGGFSHYHMKVYWAAIDLLCKLDKNHPKSGYMKDVFYLIEKSRANNVFERVFSLNKGIIPLPSSLDQKKANLIKSELFSLSKSLLNQDIDETSRVELYEKMVKLEDAYKAILSHTESEFALEIDSLHFSYCRLDKIQNELLDKKTAVLEYYLGEKKSLLFVITKDKFNFFYLPSEKIINKSVKTYLKYLIEEKDSWKDPKIEKYIRSYLFPFKLFDEDISEKIENLIIVPDGMLHFFPFEILSFFKQPDQYRYLIEKFNISYTPSLSSLLLLRNQTILDQPKKVFLGIGCPDLNEKNGKYRNSDNSFFSSLNPLPQLNGLEFSPLPHAKKEILEISKLFPEKRKEILLGTDASEYKIKHIGLDDYACIHFASHSYLDPYFPAKSAIVLSPGSEFIKEDGILQIYEIYDFHLNAELVVLSACQTGIGELVESEGPIGFPRVFLYSGARSVLLSLWKIEDKSTARFMEYFYENLSKGNNKSEALRLAKMKMINSKLSHPYHWGAFILSGDYQIKYDLF
jgi:CHAT domain-containing protein/tetratricopeptide (TPR) repeat protein